MLEVAITGTAGGERRGFELQMPWQMSCALVACGRFDTAYDAL
jgi:hypothetical protein